jgi:outer membrane receptor protein involved in Fe transport
MKTRTCLIVKALAGAALSLAAASSFAQAIAAKVGSDGAGGELEFGIARRFGVRFQAYGGVLSHTINKTQIVYDGKLKFSNEQVMFDWHPLAGSWRLSAGLVYDDNKVDLTARPSSGTFTLNGHSYPAASVGSLQGSMTFSHVSPYLGLGWGISPRGRGFFGTIDLGFRYAPNHVLLTASCGAAIQGTPVCSQLAADAAAEQSHLEDETHYVRLWPVGQFGIGWRFF